MNTPTKILLGLGATWVALRVRRSVRKNTVREVISNVRVGRADVKPWLPSHVKGVRMGNQRGAMRSEAGIKGWWFRKQGARGNARRSTGINPRKRNPRIPFLMPNISPP